MHKVVLKIISFMRSLEQPRQYFIQQQEQQHHKLKRKKLFQTQPLLLRLHNVFELLLELRHFVVEQLLADETAADALY